MKISNSTIEDIESVLMLYKEARKLMKAKGQVVWPYFPEAMILDDIKEEALWKMTVDGEISCVWSTTFSDPLIWGPKDADPSVYIHRIATHPSMRGNGLVGLIVAWAKQYAIDNDKKYIRMDTVGNNTSLIKHYGRYGFAYLGSAVLDDVSSLPAHYSEGPVCLFELKI